MIVNDLQRLRWQILDEALRHPELEFFMGERTKTNETGATRSLIHYVNTRLRQINRDYSCCKRILQNDVELFKEKGARLEPRFRRGHKRILRYINLQWKNPLLRPAKSLASDEVAVAEPLALPEGQLKPVTLRFSMDEAALMARLCQPEIRQRQSDVENGSTTLQAILPVSEQLPLILLSLGTEVEVLAPESLREKMRHLIGTFQKMYPKKEASPASQAVQGDLFGDLF